MRARPLLAATDDAVSDGVRSLRGSDPEAACTVQPAPLVDCDRERVIDEVLTLLAAAVSADFIEDNARYCHFPSGNSQSEDR